MAAATQAIYVPIKTDIEEFRRGLLQAVSIAKNTEGALSSAFGTGAGKIDQATRSISKATDTIAGLEARAIRLESLMNRSKIGSDRFQALQAELAGVKTKLDSARGAAPDLSAFQESAAIEQNAGLAVTLGRPLNDSGEPENILEVRVCKNRFGKTKKDFHEFDPKTGALIRRSENFKPLMRPNR